MKKYKSLKKKDQPVKKLSFKQYLKEAPLRSNYYLNEQKTLSFHWANWKETCLFQKENFFKEGTQIKKLEGLYKELETLKEIIVWIKSSEKTLKTTMFDLYEFYLDSRVKLYWFSENSKVMFSIGNELGPYNPLSSKKWFNIDIYRAFLYRKILTKFMPYRSFRLGMSIDVNCYFNKMKTESTVMTIHQVSEYGLILKIKDQRDLQKFKESHSVQIELDLERFTTTKSMDYKQTLEYFGDADKSENPRDKSIFVFGTKLINFYSNDLNTNGGNGKEFYIFARFEDFKNEYSILSLKDVFVPLVTKVERHFKQELKAEA